MVSKLWDSVSKRHKKKKKGEVTIFELELRRVIRFSNVNSYIERIAGHIITQSH